MCSPGTFTALDAVDMTACSAADGTWVMTTSRLHSSSQPQLTLGRPCVRFLCVLVPVAVS